MRGAGVFSSLQWIYFVSRRFSTADRRGRSAVTAALSALGVCFGVMALVVVISVMNGFQMEFIDAIMEVSSYHIRVECAGDGSDLLDWCARERSVVAVVPFYEAQGLMVGPGGREAAALVRAVPPGVMEADPGFRREVRMYSGGFDVSGGGGIVLGSELARSLGARVGSTVTIFALSGSSDVSLFSQDRKFVVRGVFYTNYADINAAYSFVGLPDGERYFGSGARRVYGVKIRDRGRDALVMARLREALPSARVEGWRGYNRTFFGALRVEKNMLMLMVFLIFVVVAVNIYNAMRRMVYERREDIAVLTALGARAREVQLVFIVKGLTTGLAGAVPGLLLGLLVCVNMDNVFMLLSRAQYLAQYAAAMAVRPAAAAMLQENPMFRVYAGIPARMVLPEVMAIFFFGIFSSLAASWVASRQILNVTVAEVLHDD